MIYKLHGLKSFGLVKLLRMSLEDTVYSHYVLSTQNEAVNSQNHFHIEVTV